MEYVVFLTIVVSFVLLAFGVFALIRNWRAKCKYQDLLRDEIARSKFADARRALFQYVAEQKISSKDEMFLFLYQANTLLMKSKGLYREIGNRIIVATKNTSLSNEPRDINKPRLSEEYIDVLKKTVDGYSYVAFNYDGVLRFLIKVGKILTGNKMTETNILLSLGRVSSKAREQAELQQEVSDLKGNLKIA